MWNSMFPALSTPRFGMSLLGAPTEFDRLFDRLVHGGDVQSTFLPLSVWEDEKGLHIEADLPGCTIEDVDLVAEQGKLRIAYSRKAPEGERKYWLDERGVGRFERTLSLPKDADLESITADLTSGVLHVHIGKKAELQPRRIQIGGGSTQPKLEQSAE